MCVQSLSLWAEATRYRLQERRRSAEPVISSDQPVPAPLVVAAEPEHVGVDARSGSEEPELIAR